MVRSRALTMPLVTVLDRPEGRAQHHHRLAHLHAARRPERDDRQVVEIDLDHGQVGLGIPAGDAWPALRCRR